MDECVSQVCIHIVPSVTSRPKPHELYEALIDNPEVHDVSPHLTIVSSHSMLLLDE
jgi:hypothetical protein